MKSAAILLALALTAGAGLAQPSNNKAMRHGDQAPMGGPMAMMQKLNLTEQQQAQIRKLHVDFQKKQIQNQAKIKLARLDLSQMLQADKPDRPAIEKIIRDISSLETDTKLARVDQMLAIRNVLTPDQLKTWKEQRMNRRGMMRGRMGMLQGQEMGMPDMAAMPDLMDGPERPMDDPGIDDLGGE
jgi:Spy/CpxP family protein refolding chaperone